MVNFFKVPDLPESGLYESLESLERELANQRGARLNQRTRGSCVEPNLSVRVVPLSGIHSTVCSGQVANSLQREHFETNNHTYLQVKST